MRLDSVVGTRVNRFTVEEKIRMPKATGGSEILYKCLCDCGKTFYVPSKTLQRHPPRDCGCGIRTPLPKEAIVEEAKPTPSAKPESGTEETLDSLVPTKWEEVVIPPSKLGFYLECLKQRLGNSKQTYRGVRYKKFINRYVAYIGFGNEEMKLGSYKSIQEAAEARLKAEIFFRGGVQVRSKSHKQNTASPKVVGDHLGIVERAGERHSAFVVIKYVGAKGNKDMWLCRCDCGKHFFVSSGGVQSGAVKDCGCGLGEKMRKPYTRHLFSNYSEYERNGTNLTLISDKRGKNINNASGVKGIYHDSKTGKWVAKLVFSGLVHREFCKTMKEAISKRKLMEKRYFEPSLDAYKESNVSGGAPSKRYSTKDQETRFELANGEGI